MTLGVATPWGRGELVTGVVGTFNALNQLGTLGVLLASDVPLSDALHAMENLAPPAGRMERHGGGELPLVVIDYAHTPDALEKVLTAMRPSVRNGCELICVFGAGGDRDRDKRPKMGAAAAQGADLVIVTSDNPRSEDPEAIVAEILAGVEGGDEVEVEPDRRAAIALAFERATERDTVVIAGKGHEQGQEFEAGRKLPFDDREVAREELRRLRSPSG
jgi:UDP-N-acetylmuramoyl-L-alanyl-D-glutamate--2,6-diaminopimelate ligase